MSGYASAPAPNGAYEPLAGEKYDQGRIYHVKAWHTWSDRRKVMTMRRMVEDYGADPRMRWFTAQVLERSGAAPRDYAAQAAALLRFVQNEIYYTNEPNEQIQSPWRTLKQRNGDCDDCSVLLASMAESIALPWRFALGGHRKINPKRDKRLAPLVARWEQELRSPREDVRTVARANLEKAANQRVRWIEGQPWPSGARFSHIYVMLGNQPFSPTAWAAAEPTVRGLPLGHDVVLHGLPDGARGGKDLGSWGGGDDTLRLPVKRFAGPDGFGAPTVIDAVGEVADAGESWWQQGESLGRAVWRNVDKPGLINSMVQGVMTAIAVGATGYYLAKYTKLKV